jgi:hypothetical protein
MHGRALSAIPTFSAAGQPAWTTTVSLETNYFPAPLRTISNKQWWGTFSQWNRYYVHNALNAEPALKSCYGTSLILLLLAVIPTNSKHSGQRIISEYNVKITLILTGIRYNGAKHLQLLNIVRGVAMAQVSQWWWRFVNESSINHETAYQWSIHGNLWVVKFSK